MAISRALPTLVVGGKTPPVGRVRAASERDRNAVLDVIRGWALLGILLVNIQEHMAFPVAPSEMLVSRLIGVFADDKFYPLFSLVFGIGIGIQATQVPRPTRLLARRLSALYAIGVLYFVFLDINYILIAYSVVGTVAVLLAVVIGLSSRWLLLSAGACLIVMAPIAAVTSGRNAYDVTPTERQAGSQQMREVIEVDPIGAAAAWRDERRSRTYAQWVRYRLDLYRSSTSVTPPSILVEILALFLVGISLVRSDVYRFLLSPEYRHGVAVTAQILLAVGLCLVIGRRVTELLLPQGRERMTEVIATISGLPLSLGYGCAIVAILNAEGRAARVLGTVSSAGRMALTNFSVQAIAMSILFQGYGFGFEGRISPIGGGGIAVSIWLLQVTASAWWLQRFHLGPVEWIWRIATYGHLIRFRKVSQESVHA